MEPSKDENDGAQVFLLGKTYLPVTDSFYIKNDPIVYMAAGDRHSILVTENGRPFAFGDNNSGQLGLGHRNATKNVSCIKSLKFADTGEKVQLAACGRESSLVATSFGSLYSFGSNSHGQLGFESDEATAVHPLPVQIVDSRSNISWKQISMGTEHSCALTDDGFVYIWGSNEDGQCGQARKSKRITTLTELPLGYAVSAMSCGYYHTALIGERGRLFLFGNNDDSQLGRSISGKKRPPLEVSLPAPVKAVACGNQHTVVLTASGQVYVCGRGDRGQLGLGVRVLATDHFQILDQHLSLQPIDIAAGEGHTAILGSRGDLYVFGDGEHGKLSSDSHSNEFQPCFVKKFKDYYVSKVVCGGCQTVILARRRSATNEVPVEHTVEPTPPAMKNPARIRRDVTTTNRSSIDLSHQQNEDVETSDHPKNSTVRRQTTSDSNEMSTSMISERLNTRHMETNGNFQPTRASLKSTTRRENTECSKPLETGELDRSIPFVNIAGEPTHPSDQLTTNARSANHHSSSESASDEDKTSVDDPRSTSVHSTPHKQVVRNGSSQVSADEKHDYEDVQSGSSTTISRSSSASSDDENEVAPVGTVDDLHHSFPSPQRLKLDEDLAITTKCESGFFSRILGFRSSQNSTSSTQKNSRTCTVM